MQRSFITEKHNHSQEPSEYLKNGQKAPLNTLTIRQIQTNQTRKYTNKQASKQMNNLMFSHTLPNTFAARRSSLNPLGVVHAQGHTPVWPS